MKNEKQQEQKVKKKMKWKNNRRSSLLGDVGSNKPVPCVEHIMHTPNTLLTGLLSVVGLRIAVEVVRTAYYFTYL